MSDTREGARSAREVAHEVTDALGITECREWAQRHADRHGPLCQEIQRAIEARDAQHAAETAALRASLATAERNARMEASRLVDELAELRVALERARAALGQWKCPLCNGTAHVPKWRYVIGAGSDLVPCRSCVDGLHPIARRALGSPLPGDGTRVCQTCGGDGQVCGTCGRRPSDPAPGCKHEECDYDCDACGGTGTAKGEPR